MSDDEKISKPVLITAVLIAIVPVLIYYLFPMTTATNSIEGIKLEGQLAPLDVDNEKTLPKKNIKNYTVPKSAVKANNKPYKAQPSNADALSESNIHDGGQIFQEKVADKYFYEYEEEESEESIKAQLSYENYEEMQREIAAMEDQYQNEKRHEIADYIGLSEEEGFELERASRNWREDFSQESDNDPETEYQNEYEARMNASEDGYPN